MHHKISPAEKKIVTYRASKFGPYRQNISEGDVMLAALGFEFCHTGVYVVCNTKHSMPKMKKIVQFCEVVIFSP